jgi:predicted GIY-YIG superfamily endonuclease
MYLKYLADVALPMTGWWSLGDIAVQRHARTGWPGVYMLADSIDVPRYVGRSDVDVQNRLSQHAASGQYRYFLVEHLRSSTAAFHRECNLYHHYRPQLDNSIHPAVPRNCGSGCPRCSYGH